MTLVSWLCVLVVHGCPGDPARITFGTALLVASQFACTCGWGVQLSKAAAKQCLLPLMSCNMLRCGWMWYALPALLLFLVASECVTACCEGTCSSVERLRSIKLVEMLAGS